MDNGGWGRRLSYPSHNHQQRSSYLLPFSIAIVATPWLVCDIADQRAGYAADSRTNGCTSDIARSNTTYDGTTRAAPMPAPRSVEEHAVKANAANSGMMIFYALKPPCVQTAKRRECDAFAHL